MLVYLYLCRMSNMLNESSNKHIYYYGIANARNCNLSKDKCFLASSVFDIYVTSNLLLSCPCNCATHKSQL